MPKVVAGYKAQARKQIMDAASAEFAERGYRRASMTQIARKIGVSKAALYQYFETKERLLEALAEQHLEEFLNSQFSPPQKRHRTTIKGSFGRGIRKMPIWLPGIICEIQLEALHDEDAKRLARTLNERFIDAISKTWVEHGTGRNNLKGSEVRTLARALMALQVGLMAQVATGLSPSKADEVWVEATRRLRASRMS